MNNNIYTIGIDGNEANIENRVGVNAYAFETIYSISKTQEKWKNSANVVVFLSREPLPHMPPESPYFKYKILPGRGLWILKTLMPHLLLRKTKVNVFWSPSHYLPPFTLTKKACSIMDLGYLDFKNQFKPYDYWQLKLWTFISIFVSNKIFAISDFTHQDIARRYPFTKSKIATTLCGYDSNRFNLKVGLKNISKVKKKYKIDGDYVLFLGTLKPSKNITGLIDSWKIVSREFPLLKLVIAGKKGWLFDDIFEKVNALGLSGCVIFTDFVGEEDKPGLIAGARVFALPSFWEGFGLDVLTSLACGTQVVVSDKGSLPEVAGEFGVLVDPSSPKDIARGIKDALSTNVNKGSIRAAKLQKHLFKFNWENTAEVTMESLLSLLH